MKLNNPSMPKDSPMNLCKISAVGAKIACAVFCADFVTMLLMNTLRLYTHWLPVIFFLALASAIVWISDQSGSGERAGLPVARNRPLLLGVIGFFVLLAGLRLPYMLEELFTTWWCPWCITTPGIFLRSVHS